MINTELTLTWWTLSSDRMNYYLRFYIPLKNCSLIWRRHNYRWRAANFRTMLSAQGLWSGRDLCRSTPAVTRGLVFSVPSEGPPYLIYLSCSVRIRVRISPRDPHPQVSRKRQLNVVVLRMKNSWAWCKINKHNTFIERINMMTYLFSRI
jgi:hypothetical protein